MTARTRLDDAAADARHTGDAAIPLDYTTSPEGKSGRYLRLTIRAANEWRPLVQALDSLVVARAVTELDMELAEFHDDPLHSAPHKVHRWRQAVMALVRRGAIVGADEETAEMLEAFGIHLR